MVTLWRHDLGQQPKYTLEKKRPLSSSHVSVHILLFAELNMNKSVIISSFEAPGDQGVQVGGFS